MPRLVFRALCFLAVAAPLACISTTIGRQDVGLLAGSGTQDWRAYLIAAPADDDAVDEDNGPMGILSDLRSIPPYGLGGSFVLATARATFGKLAGPVEARPFLDRTLRSDRLPLARGDMTPSMTAGMVTPSPLYGMAARAETTPAGLLLASATPEGAEEPLAVASLPVEEPPPPPQATFRLVSLKSGMEEPEGLTSAPRSDDKVGASATRLSHVLLLPDTELKAEQKCLAEAVYFEARGEPERGQYAVAQVVMNRTRSGFYPNKICKVVYQNRHMFNACQFSFACDRWPDRVYSRSAWNLAVRIAKEVTESGAWLPEVGGATHYHADYIRAWWAPKMIRIAKIGRHIFFRPRWLPDLGRQPAVSQVRRNVDAQDS